MTYMYANGKKCPDSYFKYTVCPPQTLVGLPVVFWYSMLSVGYLFFWLSIFQVMLVCLTIVLFRCADAVLQPLFCARSLRRILVFWLLLEMFFDPVAFTVTVVLSKWRTDCVQWQKEVRRSSTGACPWFFPKSPSPHCHPYCLGFRKYANGYTYK